MNRAKSRWSEGWSLARGIAVALADAFKRHNVLTYASAVSFQVLIALIALVLFGLALLPELGLERIWFEHVQPFVESRFSLPTYLAISSTVVKIFEQRSLLLLAFAALLAIWEVSGAVRAIMGALNEIFDCEEERSFWRRLGLSLLLAVAVSGAVVAAVLSVTLRREWLSSLPAGLDVVVGWGLAVAALLLAVWLLLRYAPSGRPGATWVTAGSILIIAAWIAASIGFHFYVTRVANYHSAIGNLVAILTLTAYLNWSSIIFLTGVELDQLARQGAGSGEPTLRAVLRIGRRSASGGGGPQRSRRPKSRTL